MCENKSTLIVIIKELHFKCKILATFHNLKLLYNAIITIIKCLAFSLNIIIITTIFLKAINNNLLIKHYIN